MKNHTDLINYIAKKIIAVSYLEIGVNNSDSNFNKVKVSDKVGVDPDPTAEAYFCITSDEYFITFSHLPIKKDIIFIDGLHHADQVKRDIQNSWNFLNVGGVIVVHDCNPHSESITHVPRDSKEWTGDVYKTVSLIVSPYFFTVDLDYGCCVIPKDILPLQFHPHPAMTWELFNKQRKSLLNLKSVDVAIKIIDAWT